MIARIESEGWNSALGEIVSSAASIFACVAEWNRFLDQSQVRESSFALTRFCSRTRWNSKNKLERGRIFLRVLLPGMRFRHTRSVSQPFGKGCCSFDCKGMSITKNLFTENDILRWGNFFKINSFCFCNLNSKYKFWEKKFSAWKPGQLLKHTDAIRFWLWTPSSSFYCGCRTAMSGWHFIYPAICGNFCVSPAKQMTERAAVLHFSAWQKTERESNRLLRSASLSHSLNMYIHLRRCE